MALPALTMPPPNLLLILLSSRLFTLLTLAKQQKMLISRVSLLKLVHTTMILHLLLKLLKLAIILMELLMLKPKLLMRLLLKSTLKLHVVMITMPGKPKSMINGRLNADSPGPKLTTQLPEPVPLLVSLLDALSVSGALSVVSGISASTKRSQLKNSTLMISTPFRRQRNRMSVNFILIQSK